MLNAAIRNITVHQLTIPLRRRVTHAASERNVAEPTVVAVELNSGVVGYGETLPREYVTGESVTSVVDAIETVFAPALSEAHPEHFPGALETVDALPWRDRAGRSIPAARAAIELALLDAFARHFHRPIADAPGWMGLNEFGPPGCLPTIRHSGVLAAADVGKTLGTLRKLWWYGIRDFKLKVGDRGDEQRLVAVSRYLARPLRSSKATLRIDVNGAWTLEVALRQLSRWKDHRLCAVEQPLPRDQERALTELKSGVHQPLMFDESLVTLDDARRLIELQVADAFNIRISKCGGLLPALRLAHFAKKHGVMVQLGCMVGETSILSAAGRKFLELVPGVRFVEGSFGSFLLTADVARKPLRFGYAGRVRPLSGEGWGIDVDPARIARLSHCTDRLVF